MGMIKRVVVKVGTKLLTTDDNLLAKEKVKNIVSQICDLQERGFEMILVSSGAIGAGMGVLGLKKRPVSIHELQAVAAVGQNQLISLYGEYFRKRGYIAAQILLTQDDFDDRKRYLNIKSTIRQLLKKKVVPVINENDTVSTDEIRCGDNDRLSGLVADLVESQLLIMLTNVDGLLDESGNLIRVIDEVSPRITKMVRATKSELSRGGMATKLEAAKRVMGAGIGCVIANGNLPHVLSKIIEKDDVGTVCKPAKKMLARKRWIAFHSKTKGVIIVDNGAKEVLMRSDKSLLASGVTGVKGRFKPQDVVSVACDNMREFARGITEYSSDELLRVKGLKTAQIKEILSARKQYEVIHKDDLVIL